MSYYHSLKCLIQGWWKQLQENNEGKKKKEKSKVQKIWDTERPSVTVKHGEQDQLMCPYTCWPSQVHLCCSSNNSEVYSDLPLSYWLHSANTHFCITPLKSHSLTNGKEHKGIRCSIIPAGTMFFQQPAPGITKSWSSVRPDTSGNITNATVSWAFRWWLPESNWKVSINTNSEIHISERNISISAGTCRNFSENLRSDLHSVKIRCSYRDHRVMRNI